MTGRKLINSLYLFQLTSDKMPVHFPASRPYIAARFIPRRLPSQFELGSGLQEGGFFNRQLDPDKSYKVFLRAYTVKHVRFDFVVFRIYCTQNLMGIILCFLGSIQ